MGEPIFRDAVSGGRGIWIFPVEGVYKLTDGFFGV